MSLSSAIIDVESNDRRFLIILVVSCLLHGIAIMAISTLKPHKKSSHSNVKEKFSVSLTPVFFPDVHVTLDANVSDTNATVIVQPPLSEEMSNSKASTSTTGISAKRKPSTLRRTDGAKDNSNEQHSNIRKKHLDITYKLEKDKFWQKAQNTPKTGGVTTNGATIVSGRLFRKVHESQKSGNKIRKPEHEDKLNGSSATSGGGSRIVKIGNRCFVLTEANPLDSISTETWARIKCKY